MGVRMERKVGRRIKTLDGYGEAHAALKRNDDEWFRNRFEGKPDDINYNGVVAFLARHNRPNLVRMMLDFGGDPNARDVYGNPAVNAAASVGSIEMMQWFLDHGAELFPKLPEKTSHFHFFLPCTPLEEAVAGNHVGMVRFLLEKGADPDEQVDRKAASNLHVAAANNNREMIDVLLDGGAKWSRVKNKVAISVAARHGHLEMLDYLLTRSRIKLNAVKAAFNNGMNLLSPLEEAVQFGNLECVKLLIEKYGADPYSSNGKHPQARLTPPPILALMTGQAEVFRYLLSRAVDPWLNDTNEWSTRTPIEKRLVEPRDLLGIALWRDANPNRDPRKLHYCAGNDDDKDLVLLVALIEKAAWSLPSYEDLFLPLVEKHPPGLWDNQRPAYHLARALLKTGDTEKAREYLVAYLHGIEAVYEAGIAKHMQSGNSRDASQLAGYKVKDTRLVDAKNLLAQIDRNVVNESLEIPGEDELVARFKGKFQAVKTWRAIEDKETQREKISLYSWMARILMNRLPRK